MDIILYLLQLIQYLYQQNCWLINFICKYIPLKQWVFDDSHSPKYQKFKIDELPIVEKPLPKLSWKKIIDEYPGSHNGKTLNPSAEKRIHISHQSVNAHGVMLRLIIFTVTMAKQANFCVKYARPRSQRIPSIPPQSFF